MKAEGSMPKELVLEQRALPQGPWPCEDPFLFCAYHRDEFPQGNGKLGPDAGLGGRDIGQDFANKDGWNMYHGETVPGFPRHPHRGFETVTIVRQGLMDHADSLGAAARYGQGDTQWLTTGKGIAHSEMFPLLNRDGANPMEAFQVWLNLAPAQKMAPPRFNMLWSERIPTVRAPGVEVRVIAGSLEGQQAPPPPPDSWASQPGSEVAIWTLRLEPGARWTLPAAVPGLNRALYFYAGETLSIGGQALEAGRRVLLDSGQAAELLNGPEPSALLLLQGKPIGAPVANYGPFVMNTQQELMQAFEDFRRNEFGGWTWPSLDPVHGERGRFARFPGGATEEP
jgi:redox-sensitive bicupin YhaK (pirin superfamily)